MDGDPANMMNKAPAGPSNPRQTILHLLDRPAIVVSLVCVAGFVLYSGALRFEFVWDDYEQVVSNPAIRSLTSVLHSFQQHLWFQSSGSGSYYRPVFIAWSYLTFLIFNLEPWGWHLMALLLHLAASALVYPLARKLDLPHGTAVLACLLFVVHPVHVEVAAWVSAASDSLVTALFIAAFLAWIDARRRAGRARVMWLLLSCLLLACALFTKEMAAPFVMVAFAYAWLRGRQEGKSLWTSFVHATFWSVPSLLVICGYLLVRARVLHGFAAPAQAAGWEEIVLTAPSIVLQYMRLLVFPSGLSAMHYTPQYSQFSWTGVLIPAVLIAGCAALIVWTHRRTQQMAVATGAAWFLLTLLPVLYLPVFEEGNAIRDRYAYLPSVGFLLLAAAAIGILFRRWPRIVGPAAAVAFVLLTGVSLLDQANWSNDLLLAYRGYRLNPQNPRAVDSYGFMLGEHNPEASIQLTREYLAQHGPDTPHYSQLMYNLAKDYLQLGQSQAALEALRQGDERDPASNSTTALVRKANMYGGVGEYSRSLEIFQQLLEREPDSYMVVYNCGYTYFLARQYPQAERMLGRAARLVPDLPKVRYYLGLTLLAENKFPEAEAQLRVATALDPQASGYHLALGSALELQRKTVQAAEEYQMEMRLHPEDPRAAARLAALQSRR